MRSSSGVAARTLAVTASDAPRLSSKRALELLVLPPGGVLALAPNPDVGSAAALPDRGLFGDESSIKACPCAWNDLDDFHERPLPRLPVGKIYNDRPPQHYPGTVQAGPAGPSEHRRSAAPFRRFRCRMGGRWDVALARFCWISCTVGAVVLPTPTARTQDRALTACHFEAAGAGKVSAIIDGRSFVLDDGREVRLAGIEVPFRPRPAKPGHGPRPAVPRARHSNSILAGQSIELRQRAPAFDRYGRTLAHVYVGAMRAADDRSPTKCWRRAMRGLQRRWGTGPAPPSSWPGNAPPGRQNLAFGANHIMP